MKKLSNFDEMWRQKTDDQLFDALAHKDDYIPESLEAIKRELESRNLPVQQLEELEAHAQNNIEDEATNALLPLQWPLRILMFLLSFGLLQVVVGEYYRNKGYNRKSREVWIWMAYGIVFWLGVGFLKAFRYS